MIFRQFFESDSSTYTYILADPSNRQAAIVDPVDLSFERDLQFVKELGLNLTHLIETHVHADHITSANKFKDWKGDIKTVVSKVSGANYQDIAVKDGDIIEVGSLKIKVISTPGHTDGCTSYFVEDRVFTGDTLLIRGCGRTDFQQGSTKRLFESVRTKLFSLPEETLVYPAHDYKGRTCSSIGEEKLHNPRLKLENSFEDFDNIMKSLDLAKPKRIEEAVPANLNGGSY